MVLSNLHPAVVEGRSLFERSANRNATGRLLKPGMYQRKLGNVVTKGKWKGFPIFALTLEERATCPRSCLQWNSCVVPETKVLTTDLRWVAIGTVHEGDRILGFDEESDEETGARKTRIATVEAVGRIKKRCLVVSTSKGTLTTTEDHGWIAKKDRSGYDWFRTDQLNVGDKLQFFAQPWKEDRSFDAGRVSGFVDGEGHVGVWDNDGFPKSRLGWSQLPGALLSGINSIVREKGFDVIVREVISGVNKSTICLNEVGGGWRNILRFLGTFRPVRLISKAEELLVDRVLSGRGSEPATVLSIVDGGMQEVVEIATSTRTLITEGFLSHNCYGNHMRWAVRVPHGVGMMSQLADELAALQRRYPRGFVVRLHILGDFFSVDYVSFWAECLKVFPALRVFGYTARTEADEIGRALRHLIAFNWDRFAIRSSGGGLPGIPASVVVHAGTKRGEAVPCPAQHDDDRMCANCAFCWHSKRAVSFIEH